MAAKLCMFAQQLHQRSNKATEQVKSNLDDLISVAPVGWILTWRPRDWYYNTSIA